MTFTTRAGKGSALTHAELDGTLQHLLDQMIAKPITFGFAGDSIAVMWGNANGSSPLTWAKAIHYPCNTRRIFNSGVGGTSSSHLISTQIAQLEALATKPDVVVVQTFQNDTMTTTALADSFYAYAVEYVTRALAAGVKQVWLCSRPPKVGEIAGNAYSITYLNRRLRQFCDATPGAVYIDVFNLWRDMDVSRASTQINFKNTAGTTTAYSQDGVHPTALAMSAVGSLVGELLSKIAMPISPFEASLESYDNSTRIWANFLGPNGQMLGTLGRLNGVDNAGVAGTAAATATRWAITAANGVTVTPSIVTDADGYRYQQIVLGGTASADTTVSISCTPAFNVVAGNFVTEAIVELENVSRVRSVLWRNNQQAVGTNDDTPGTSELPANYTARMHCRSDPYALEVTNFSGNNHQLQVSIRNGASPTGTIRLGRCGTYRVS